MTRMTSALGSWDLSLHHTRLDYSLGCVAHSSEDEEELGGELEEAGGSDTLCLIEWTEGLLLTVLKVGESFILF